MHRIGWALAVTLFMLWYTPPIGAWQRPQVIDFHGHLDAGAAQRINRIMDTNGVAILVNLSGGHFGGGLQSATSLAKQLPSRVINFYTPDWSERDQPWWGVREAQRLEVAVKQAGFKGLKISKALGLYLRDKAGVLTDVDDPRLDPLWERAGMLGIPVSIHTSDPKAFWDPLTPGNERYDELQHHPGWSFFGKGVPSRNELLAQRDRMIAKHPLTTFVCVHFANNPEDLDYVARLLETHPNVYVDIAARVPEIGRHPAHKVRALFLRFQDRIVFGTDIGISRRGLMLGSSGGERPSEADAARFYATHWRFLETHDRDFAHPTPIQGRWKISGIGLPPHVLQKIYRSNAEHLLGLRPVVR